MIKVNRVDHVGIAVKSTEGALPFYDLLGLRVTAAEDLSHRGLKIAFLPAGECKLELLEPTRPDSTVGKHVEEQGEGIHHICLAVEDIDGAVKQLIEAGVRMIDQAPRPGGGGHRVAFVHPDSTRGVLLELLED